MTPETATPVGSAIARVRALEQLLARVEAELAAARKYLVRVQNLADRVDTTGAVPSEVAPADVRDWARANGWPDLSPRGRFPVGVVAAYLNRNKP